MKPRSEDQLEIEELVFRYGVALDSLDCSALQACFVPGPISPEQFEEIIEYHRRYSHTMHNVHNRLHTVQNDTAKGITYCVASMVEGDGDKLTKFDVYIMYRDDLVKQDGRWLFEQRKLEVAFSTDREPVKPGAPLIGLGIQPSSFREHSALNSNR